MKMIKRCPKCTETKLINEFNLGDSYCNPCRRAYAKAKGYGPKPGPKTCFMCKEYLPADAFYARCGRCKECTKAYKAKLRATQRELIAHIEAYNGGV